MGQHLSSRTSLIAPLLAASLLGLPRSASAGEPLQLVVDTSTLAESDRERLRTTVLESVSEALASAGREVVDTAPTTLRVRIQYLDEENLDYTIFYDVLDDAELLGEAPSLTCSACVDAKLVRTIVEGVPSALTRIDELAAAETKEEPPASEPPPPAEVHDAPRVKPLGPLGGVGIVVVSGGIAAAIVGALDLSKGRVPSDDLSKRLSVGDDYTGRGQLLVGIGAGAVVVGAVMLGVDLGLRAKRRKQSSHALVVPSFSPRYGGISITGRF